jgi:pimeloyl-ACP methyl ester carboxylesterase
LVIDYGASKAAPERRESALTGVRPDGHPPRPSVFDAVPIPGAGGDVDLYVKSVFPDAFANDLLRTTAAVLAAVQRPVAFSALVTPSGAPARETIPSWYFVGTLDHVLPPAAQRFMAERGDANTVEDGASHVPMVSRPRAVTRLILEAAEAID